MSSAFRMGIIGTGSRGMSLLKDAILGRDNVKITAICDLNPQAAQTAAELCGAETVSDYRTLIDRPDVDIVCVFSAWANHIPAAIYAMNAGKPVAIEVGGAYDADDCWELVRTYERTGVHCMMLENCCYDRREMMVMRMVREGVFGRIAHAEGGYQHDLRWLLSEGPAFRLDSYKTRCCDVYPTHALGPIAKILDINRGNRMVSLSAMASGAWGLNEYAAERGSGLADVRFAQGDIVKTNIKCAGGELITLTFDMTLPRNYSRNFTIRGTKGYYSEVCGGIYLDGMPEDRSFYGNADKFSEQYEHPVWEKFLHDGVRGGHGGMDWLIFDAWLESLEKGCPPPIDTYDAAAWMAITPLSEQSIRQNGAPVAIPDFTRGMWTCRHPDDHNNGFYTLDK